MHSALQRTNVSTRKAISLTPSPRICLSRRRWRISTRRLRSKNLLRKHHQSLSIWKIEYDYVVLAPLDILQNLTDLFIFFRSKVFQKKINKQTQHSLLPQTRSLPLKEIYSRKFHYCTSKETKKWQVIWSYIVNRRQISPGDLWNMRRTRDKVFLFRRTNYCGKRDDIEISVIKFIMFTDSLSGVESPSVQESLRNAKQIVRTKNSRSTAVDEEKIHFLNELVVMVKY